MSNFLLLKLLKLEVIYLLLLIKRKNFVKNIQI